MCNAITRGFHFPHSSPQHHGRLVPRENFPGCGNPCDGQLQQNSCSLSAEALAGMRLPSLVGMMMGGDFGQLMALMGQGNGSGCQAVDASCPEFGKGGVAGPPTESGCKVSPGQTRELKEGETVRGANGTQLTWGKGDNVDIKYKDKTGQTKTIKVKDGMISFDGGKPQKLENTGQLLKLPNGDVIGLGNQNTSDGGKDLCRVVMADSTDKVACNPPQATNIYDVEQMEHRQTSMQGGGISMSLNTARFDTPMGTASFASASMQVFLGHPVTRTFTEQLMSLAGAK